MSLSRFNSAQSSQRSDAQSFQNSDAESLRYPSTTSPVVIKSTPSIFTNFLPNITILIAQANSTNITEDKATSLATTLSSIPSLQEISKNFNSADSITQIITTATTTTNTTT